MSNFIEIFGVLKDISFGGPSIATKDFYVYDYVKSVLPNQKETLIDIPGIPGLLQLKKKFTNRTIRVFGFLECSSHAELITKMQDLSAFLYSDRDQQLILSDEDDRYYNAQYLDYQEVELKVDYAIIMLEFNCNDPFGYAIIPDSEPDGSPIIPITENGYTWDITNSGQYHTYPIITITFYQSQNHIYIINNTLGGTGFDISKPFYLGDVLIIDSKEMLIKLNGEYSPVGFGDGGEGRAEFLILMGGVNEGVNELQIGSDDIGDIDVDVNVTFRKVYL